MQQFKVIMLGDAGAGKTSVVQRIVNDRLADGMTVPTCGVDIHWISYRVAGTSSADVAVTKDSADGNNVQLQLVDTAGTERYEALSTQFFRGAHAAIIVIDASDPGHTSLARLRTIVSMLQKHNGTVMRVLLLANKLDRPRRLERTCLEAEARLWNYHYGEISCLAPGEHGDADQVALDLVGFLYLQRLEHPLPAGTPRSAGISLRLPDSTTSLNITDPVTQATQMGTNHVSPRPSSPRRRLRGWLQLPCALV
jgi:small GTP-binding protein